MDKYIIKTEDEIVQRVIEKIDSRSEVGMKKYGKAMMEEVRTGEKDLHAFIVDVQEELMDALLYLESAKECLQNEIEEGILKHVRPEKVERGMYGSKVIKKGPCAMYEFEEDEERMDVIGQNGNTGAHYEKEEKI